MVGRLESIRKTNRKREDHVRSPIGSKSTSNTTHYPLDTYTSRIVPGICKFEIISATKTTYSLYTARSPSFLSSVALIETRRSKS